MKPIITALVSTILSFNAYAEGSNHDSNENINHAEYEETFEEEFSQPSQLMNSSGMSRNHDQMRNMPEQAAEAPKRMDTKDYKKKPKDTVY